MKLTLYGPEALQFDSLLHEYRYKNKKIPGVTRTLNKILGSFYMGPMSDDDMMFYLERGEEIHRICENYIKDILDEDSIDPSLRGFFESFVLWFDSYMMEPRPGAVAGEDIYMEATMCHGGMYAGRIDILLPDRNPIEIIDIKSGGESPIRDSMQLMAYRGDSRAKISNVYLNEDGTKAKHKIRRINAELRLYYRIFQCQVSVLNFANNI